MVIQALVSPFSYPSTWLTHRQDLVRYRYRTNARFVASSASGRVVWTPSEGKDEVTEQLEE